MNCRRYCRFVSLIGILLWSQIGQSSTQITQVEFLGTQDPSEILIHADGPLVFEKQENTPDKQVILEFKDAKLANKTLEKGFDTSSFRSQVNFISPYQVEGKELVRMVIQLREMTAADVKQEGNLLRVRIPVGGVARVAKEESKASEPQTESLSKSESKIAEAKSVTLPSEFNSKADKLKEFFEARETKRFIGRPITLRVRDAEVVDVFRLIGEASGFNIILGDDVKGKITLSLTDVPWDLALDTVLHTLRLGAERNNNVLRVMTLGNLATEKQEQLRAKRASEATAPLITRVFPISYANLAELQGILTRFGSAGGPAGTDPSGTGAVVQLDNRTNSIIVRDIPDNVERMKKLIEILDTQTPQVMIEAKIVEASEQFASQINGGIGVGNSLADAATPQFFASFTQANPVDALIGSPGAFADGTAIGKTTADSGGFGISFPTLSFLPGVKRLNALLNLGERESQVQVIASPKTVVLNKEKGNIVQGTPVLVPGASSIPGVGVVPVATVQSANLSLDVKPTVTNDGNIMLELGISRDIPLALDNQNNGIAKRSLNTIVVVESGSTLVIGGIYTMTNSKKSSGFPFLRKIPIIGWLFGSESQATDRSELFIFITPRIINEKEAGLSG